MALRHTVVKAFAVLVLLFAAFYSGAQKGYIDGYRDTAADMTEACNAAIASQEPEISYYGGIYFKAPFDLNNAMRGVDDEIPENGTNCLPRATLLNEILQNAGYDSQIEVGYLHCNRTGLKYGHAWVDLHLEIWGSRRDYPIYNETEVE